MLPRAMVRGILTSGRPAMRYMILDSDFLDFAAVKFTSSFSVYLIISSEDEIAELKACGPLCKCHLYAVGTRGESFAKFAQHAVFELAEEFCKRDTWFRVRLCTGGAKKIIHRFACCTSLFSKISNSRTCHSGIYPRIASQSLYITCLHLEERVIECMPPCSHIRSVLVCAAYAPII